jgi:hypothetical protein
MSREPDCPICGDTREHYLGKCSLLLTPSEIFEYSIAYRSFFAGKPNPFAPAPEPIFNPWSPSGG